ncbi:hypothetical protein R6Q57_022251 [Mikania cordata]
MAPAAGNDDGEAYQNTVFLTTSLDTRLATTVSVSDTVSHFKERIILEHRQCFPAMGNIKIHSLKVKRGGVFYHLSDSMPVKSAFGTTKRNWFVSVDASSLEKDINIQHFDKHKAADPVALLRVTHNHSIDGHHNHEPLSIQPKTIPFVNQMFSNGSKCIEEDRSSVDNQLAINKEVISKKRVCDMSNQSLLKDPSGCEHSVKKKRKTQKVKSNAKVSEGNIVSTYDDDDDDKGKYRGIDINNENSFEHKSKNKDLIGENTRINNCEKHYDLDQVAAVSPSSLEIVGRESVTDMAMVAAKNIQHGTCKKEKENELIQKVVTENETPSASTRTSDCERNATGLNAMGPLNDCLKHFTKPKAAEKEISSTPFIKKLKHINKDAIDSSQKDVGSSCQDSRVDLIDKHTEERETSLIQGLEVKLPERRKKVKKSAAIDKSQTIVMHADDNPVAPVLDEILIGNENEVLETPIDDYKKNDEMIVKEMEVLEPTNSLRNWVHAEYSEERSKSNLKDTAGSRKRKKDVGKTTLKIDKSVVKQSNDVATSIDALHVDCVRNDDVLNNNVELFRTEANLCQVQVEAINNKSKKQNGKMDGVKKDKRKKKTIKSASRIEDNAKEGENSLHDDTKKPKKKKKNDSKYDGDIQSQKIISKNEGLVGKAKKSNKSSPTGLQDQLSEHRSTENEIESEKSQKIDHHHHLEDISSNVTVTKVPKVNNKVDITNDESHEINFLDHFAPDRQLNQIVSIDNEKDTKKPKNKTIDDFMNDDGIESQKTISKIENNKVVTDANIPNIVQIKIPITAGNINADSRSSSKTFGRSFHNQESNKQQLVVNPVKKALHVGNNLLNRPGKIFGDDDNDRSSADDNATVNSDSSTRTPSRTSSLSLSSSSLEESASSIDSRRNSNCSPFFSLFIFLNESKKVSMTDLLRSSSRFKKAKFSASQVNDTESQPVDIITNSQPFTKR